MPFPDLPPERIPGSPGHLNDHQLIDQALDYIQQAGYRDDPNFPPLPDVPVLGQSGHVTAHDRILAILEYLKAHPAQAGIEWAKVSNNPTGTYKGDDGHTYAYYRFTTSGTLTVTTAGLLEVLVVGCGGKAYQQSGSGGQVRDGLHIFDSGSHAVTVGTSLPSSSPHVNDGLSRIGPVTAYAGICDASGTTAFGQNSRGTTSAITGANLTYGYAKSSSPRPHYGDGAYTTGPGSSGVVIVKTRLN